VTGKFTDGRNSGAIDMKVNLSHVSALTPLLFVIITDIITKNKLKWEDNHIMYVENMHVCR